MTKLQELNKLLEDDFSVTITMKYLSFSMDMSCSGQTYTARFGDEHGRSSYMCVKFSPKDVIKIDLIDREVTLKYGEWKIKDWV
jgi:hypothetical protein